MVSPAWLTLSNWSIWVCSILLIWEASRLASQSLPRRTSLRDHGLRGNRVVPTVHWLSSQSMPTGLSAIHKVSPPYLRRGLHGSVKRHASSPFSTNSLAPWLPSSSPACLHLLKSGSRNTASIHLVWGGRRRALAQLTVPARVTHAPHPSAVETRAPRTDSRTGLRPVEQQGPGGGSCQAET